MLQKGGVGLDEFVLLMCTNHSLAGFDLLGSRGTVMGIAADVAGAVGIGAEVCLRMFAEDLAGGGDDERDKPDTHR